MHLPLGRAPPGPLGSHSGISSDDVVVRPAWGARRRQGRVSVRAVVERLAPGGVMPLTAQAAKVLADVTAQLESLPEDDARWVLQALQNSPHAPPQKHRKSTAGGAVSGAVSGAATPDVSVPHATAAAPQRHNAGSSVSFEQFWNLYPRKRDRQDAERSWKKLQPDQDLVDRILRALREQITWPDWTKENGQFIPYPSSWLNRKRWEDAADAAPQGTASGTATANALVVAAPMLSPTLRHEIDRALKGCRRLGNDPVVQGDAYWYALLGAHEDDDVDPVKELLKAEAWMTANPGKAPRKDVAQFFLNWCERARG